MFVSSAEPASVRAAMKRTRRTHSFNGFPEKHGCDFIWSVDGAWCGVQRKEIRDLISSMTDGRLHREKGQIGGLAHVWLIVEGEPRWTNDGTMTGVDAWGKAWTFEQYHGLVASLQAAGFKVLFTRDVRETVKLIWVLHDWTKKDRHASLDSRPGPVSVWGKANHRDYQSHLLQGLPGVGSELAGRIIDQFGGVPWKWTVTRDDLMKVRGIAKGKVGAIWNAFESPDDATDDATKGTA